MIVFATHFFAKKIVDSTKFERILILDDISYDIEEGYDLYELNTIFFLFLLNILL